ncbi:tyrosine-type recombinase/integrase [Bacillus sp. RIT809]|nr:tyrosine-type recombinase/integrase [Bacillus sp. RIT 809]
MQVHLDLVFFLVNSQSITIHSLRHTHCTILLNQGLNVKVIAERLGNTPQMIYEIYGHVLKEMESMSVELFSQSLAESGANLGAS